MASWSASPLPELVIEFNESEMAALFEKFKGYPGAIQAAILEASERARRQLRNELAREFKKQVTLKPAYIGRGIKSKKAQITGDGAQAEVKVATEQMPLANYGVKLSAPSGRIRKVEYKLRYSGKTYGDLPKNAIAPPGARLFIARMKSGHVGAYFRMGKKRLPIAQEYAPSLQYHAYIEGFLPHMEDFAQTRFKAAFLEEASKITGVNRS